MLNKQGDYEGVAQWDVLGNDIGLISYNDSADLVCDLYYRQAMEATIEPTPL